MHTDAVSVAVAAVAAAVSIPLLHRMCVHVVWFVAGGASGFSMRVWDARKVELLDGEAAVLHLLSPDGDQVRHQANATAYRYAVCHTI
jgi:hypothetical protein